MGKYIKIFALLFLTGCFQSTASLIGPAYTIGSSGNIYQAGLTYSLNETLQITTGQSTIDHAKMLLENTKNSHKQSKKKLKELKNYTNRRANNIKISSEEFFTSVKSNIEKIPEYFIDR